MNKKEAIEILEGLAVPIHAEAAFDMAVETLKKQIPMKPRKVLSITGKPIWECGNCGEELGDGEFCQWCGQRVDR